MHHAFSLMPDEQDELKRMLAREFSLMLSEFSDAFGISLGGYIAYLMLFCIIALFANIVTILGCVSLGQLYAKHRIVGAIVAYFIVQFVMQVINNICFIPMYTKMMIDGYNSDVLSPFGILSPTMNLSLFMAVALAVIMYFVNLHMMTKKLNLE